METPPRACPRCGSTGIADTGQHVEVVRLKRVFSDIRRDDARIGDDSDERRRTPFEVVTAVDFDPDRREGQWAVEHVGLGVAHYRRLPVRWFNVGQVTGAPASSSMAGREVTAQLFRICQACGKLDRDAGTSSASEHRAWCPYRQDRAEHTRLLALGRELVTQGVAISLPPVVSDGLYDKQALAAALMLGLRETMGGAPDHLRIEIVPHPVGDGGQVRDALFLHDTVPGGTGYLTDLASPERLWGILVRAAKILENCPCQDEGRASCYRCLLPFVRRADHAHRVDALRALKHLLQVPQEESVAALDEHEPAWTMLPWIDLLPSPAPAPLEDLFRATLRDALRESAGVRERPGPRGIELVITSADRRVWTLRPQLDVHGTRPDFVLEPTGGAPSIAIYTDGWRYHASPGHNRLADDAEKRERLRANGYHVMGVTWSDLASKESPPWLNETLIAALMQLPAGTMGAGVSLAAAAEHRGGAVALLTGIVGNPADSARGHLADAAPLLLGLLQGDEGRSSLAPDDDLMDAAVGLLEAEPNPVGSGDDMLLYRRSHLVFAARVRDMRPVEMVLVLDDSEDALAEPEHADAWREWLRLSNLLDQSSVPCRITTRSRVAAVSPGEGRVGDAWTGVDLTGLDTETAQLASSLAGSGVGEPSVGEELDGGVMVELAWPRDQVAVVYAGMPHEEIEILRSAGWIVHEIKEDVDAVAAEVRSSLLAREGK